MTQLCHIKHEHKHGGANCYDIGKCRCQPCRTGNSTRTRKRRRLKAYGRWEGLIDATGTQRRIQGLQVLGFTFDQIGEAAGVNRNTVWRVLNETTVEPKTRDRITNAFKVLMRNPAGGASPRTAAQAKAKGYPSPLAWDDIDTDAEPTTGTQTRIGGDELITEIEWLIGAGTPAHEIAAAVGKNREAIERLAWRYGRNDIATYIRERAVA